MELRSSKVSIAPSTTTSGSLPLYDGIPLMKTVGLAPGEPAEITSTPAALPCKASSALTGFSFSMSTLLMVEIAPETLVTFCVP